MNDFWYGKRVLITGGDGFAASNLAYALMERGAVVVVTVRHQRPVPTSVLLTGELRPDIEVSDMTDFLEVQRICNRHQIDTIFHLAASAIVSDAANAPMSTLQNNIIPTLNLLEAARVNSIPRVLIASTDKSYGDHADEDDPEPLPYREGYALRGMDVYSASKACADLITQTYGFQFKLPVIIVRSCNIFGPGDLNFTRLIPRSTLRMLRGDPPVINLGNADVLREYVYVDDVVGAYMFLAENLDKHYVDPIPQRGRVTYGHSAYNVGSYTPGQSIEENGNIKSVVQVIEEIRSIVGSDASPQTIPKAENFIEIPDQFLDSSKLFELGFRPKVDFTEGVRRAVDWYRSHQELLTRMGANHILLR